MNRKERIKKWLLVKESVPRGVCIFAILAYFGSGLMWGNTLSAYNDVDIYADGTINTLKVFCENQTEEWVHLNVEDCNEAIKEIEEIRDG